MDTPEPPSEEPGPEAESPESTPITTPGAAGLSDVGQHRDVNEDSFAVHPDLGLYVVADGMGGRGCGEVASRIAVEAIARYIRSSAAEGSAPPFHHRGGATEEGDRLAEAIRVANREIFEEGLRPERRGMGTTVVAALYCARSRQLHIGHAGDSRAYRVRGGGITQLTRDHCFISANPPAVPDWTEEEIEEFPWNAMGRVLGMGDTIRVDLLTDHPRPGDVYLLCSDGVSCMLADSDVLAILSATRDPAEMCRRLVDGANEQGGEDNITAVVLLFSGLLGQDGL